MLASGAVFDTRTVAAGGLHTRITSWSCDVMADDSNGNQILTWT